MSCVSIESHSATFMSCKSQNRSVLFGLYLATLQQETYTKGRSQRESHPSAKRDRSKFNSSVPVSTDPVFVPVPSPEGEAYKCDSRRTIGQTESMW